ncbi:MAG: exonuclease SbcCD subunit D [Eubacteriales bacterium]
MRILHTSDWHLGKNLEQINRIEEQKEFINEFCTIVEEEKIDLILIAGDIFDTYNPSAAAEELFYDAINRLNDKGKRAVVVIAGNHDNPERLCAASPLAYKNGIILLGYPNSNASDYKVTTENIKIINSGSGWLEISIKACEHNAVIITLPYPSESRLEEMLSSNADEQLLQKAYSEKIGSVFISLSENYRDDTVNLAVGHLFMRGGKESDSERTLQVGGALTVDAGMLPSNAHFVALGHLHRPQEIKKAPCPVFYSGSPLAYSFSEAEYSKAVYIVDVIPGQQAEIKPYYLKCGKPLKKWVAKEGIGQALQWCEEGKDKNAWVDLEIVTDRILTIEEQKKLRSLHNGILHIRPRLKQTEQIDMLDTNRESRSLNELFKDYFHYRTGSKIPDELMKTFLEVINDEDEEIESTMEEGGVIATETT